MESFVLSASLAFVVYEAMAFARPPQPQASNFTIGQVAIAMGARAALWAKRIVLALLVFGILFFLLIIHEYVFPFDLISQNRTNITLGLLTGPMFAIWLNSIIRRPAEEGLTRGQIVAGIGLVLLFVLGSVGNETGKLIARFARHVSSLKVPGAEVSFSEGGRHGSTPSAPSTAPAGVTGGSGFISSQGLQYAAHLSTWFVQRDQAYLSLFKALDQDLKFKLDRMARLATDVIEPPLNCLLAWREARPDASSVSRHLRAFSRVFAYLNALDDAAVRKRFTDDYVQQVNSLVVDTAPFKAMSQQCAIKPSAVPIDDVLDGVVAAHEWQERPYLAIVQASLMAQLEQYEAATRTLADWADNRKRALAANWPTEADWFDLRARSILGAYMEEWVQSNEGGVATPLRDEHLQNLDALRRGLKRFLTREETGFFKGLLKDQWQKDRDPFVAPSGCSFHDRKENEDSWRRLFTSYVSIALTYEQNVLLHPAYATTFAETSSGDLRILAQLDLSCVLERGELLYAQLMEAYTRNAILYSDVRRDSESDDAKTARLGVAAGGGTIGLELATKAARAELPAPDAPFSKRIAPGEGLATREALTSNLQRLKSLKEE